MQGLDAGALGRSFAAGLRTRLGDSGEAAMIDSLVTIFRKYCAFGVAALQQPRSPQAPLPSMDCMRFAKFCRESKLTDARLTPSAVDLLFSKLKPAGTDKISFIEFCGALKVIAALKGMSHESYLAAEVADRDPEAALARFSSKNGGLEGSLAQRWSSARDSVDMAPRPSEHTAGVDFVSRRTSSPIAPVSDPTSTKPACMDPAQKKQAKDYAHRLSSAIRSGQVTTAEVMPSGPAALLGDVFNEDARLDLCRAGAAAWGEPAGAARKLQRMFQAYCAFGTVRIPNDEDISGLEMDSMRFAKFCRECNLTEHQLTPSGVDLIFAKCVPAGHRKLDFWAFLGALYLIAHVQNLNPHEVTIMLGNHKQSQVQYGQKHESR